MVDNTQNILIEHFNQFITHFIISIESVHSKRDEIKWNNISIRVTKKPAMILLNIAATEADDDYNDYDLVILCLYSAKRVNRVSNSVQTILNYL
jgi:hypothetical protein